MSNEILDQQPQGFITDSELPLKGVLSIVIIHFIKDKPMHGGEIYQKMKDIYQIDAPRGIMYAILRRMEADGLMTSNWEIQESGPARRMYQITERGVEYARVGIERVKKTSRIIARLLENIKSKNTNETESRSAD